MQEEYMVHFGLRAYVVLSKDVFSYALISSLSFEKSDVMFETGTGSPVLPTLRLYYI